MKVAKLTKDAIIPTRKHITDAGMDIYSSESGIVEAHKTNVFKTGITMEIPKGYVAQAWPKSRSDYNVGAGIIDDEYQGEILIKIQNHMDFDIVISKGDAIAQIVFVPVHITEIEEVDMDNIHTNRVGRINDGITKQKS